MADDKWVWMTHPKVQGDPARVTRDAYELLWKDKGWKLLSQKAVADLEKPEG